MTLITRTGLDDEGEPYREFYSDVLGFSGVQYSNNPDIWVYARSDRSASLDELRIALQEIIDWLED